MSDTLHTLYRKLPVGESANRWNLAETVSEKFPGPARSMPDRVDYRFRNGWVDTGYLPCREAWLQKVETRQIELSDRSFPHVYIGAENPRVDFSMFCHQPTVVSRWARCSLRVAANQTLRFLARTCGGMRVWCDETPVLVHEPFTRNKPVDQTFEFTVESGEHELTVFLDELHERDTNCYFELQLLQGIDVETGLSLRSDPQRLAEAERMMAGLRTVQIFHTEGTVCITSDALPDKPLQLTLKEDELIQQNQSPSAVLENRHPGVHVSVVLGKDLPPASVLPVNQFVSGCPMMSWQCVVGDVALYRRIGTSVLSAGIDLPGDDLQQRKNIMLATLETHMRKVPAHALIMLHQDLWDTHAQKNFDHMLDMVRARDDCADFHMMSLLWIATQYASRLSPGNLFALQETLLGFRYWLDEPGNDVMWFWSENHVLCFHVAQHLAGSLYENHAFGNSGKRGYEHAQQATQRLHRWFDSIDEHGLAEWNSAAYYPIDLRGLLTLYVNTSDTQLAGRARSLMDRIFKMAALHTLDGVPTGSQGRAYEKELLAGPATELGAVTAVAFGGRWYPGHDTAAAMLAISGVPAPYELAELANVPEGISLSAHYQQGLDGHARLNLWKTRDVQLSSVCDHDSGEPGHQQHLVDLHLAGHPYAGMWINHPGELQIWGEGRPSYWAGNGVLPRVAQHRDVAFLIYDLTLQHTEISFTHVFCPHDVMDEINTEHTGWLFARFNTGYAAIYSSGTLDAVTSGLYAGSEWRVHQQICGWIMIAGSEYEYSSFEGFVQVCLARQPRFSKSQRRLDISGTSVSDVDHLRVSFDSPLYCNDVAVPFSAVTCEPQISSAPLMQTL